MILLKLVTLTAFAESSSVVDYWTLVAISWHFEWFRNLD